MTWQTRAVCRTRPADWWETGDPGNRLAMTLCRLACPVRVRCESDDPAPTGVIRAGHAYSDYGVLLTVCPCGRPIVIHAAQPGWCRTCEPAAVCGLAGGYDRHLTRGERPCGPCRAARNRARRERAARERRQLDPVRSTRSDQPVAA